MLEFEPIYSENWRREGRYSLEVLCGFRKNLYPLANTYSLKNLYIPRIVQGKEILIRSYNLFP